MDDPIDNNIIQTESVNNTIFDTSQINNDIINEPINNIRIDAASVQNNEINPTIDILKTEVKQDAKLPKLTFPKIQKLLKITLITAFILSLFANIVLGFYSFDKNKAYKTQQSIINRNSDCPTSKKAAVLAPATETPTISTPTPAPTTTSPPIIKKKTPTTISPKTTATTVTQEDVILPPPPPE